MVGHSPVDGPKFLQLHVGSFFAKLVWDPKENLGTAVLTK